MRTPARSLASLAVLAGAAFAFGCATAPRAADSPIERGVAAAAVRCGCRIGVAAKHLESGKTYERLGDAEFEGASVTKIAILTEAIAEARDGKVDLGQRWTMSEDEKADGSGILLLLDGGIAPTWNDLLTLMIGPSDNTATNAWIRRLGIDAINARMESLGFSHLRLLHELPSYASRAAAVSGWQGLRFGALTPRDLARWYEQVATGDLLDAESARRIFEYLDKDPTRLRAARRFRGEDLWAGKSGSMSGVRNDSGILRTRKGRFVLVVLTDGATGSAPNAADHPSVLAIADVAKAIVDAWSAELPDLPEKPK